MNKRTNEQWLADLKSKGPARETALADLRAIILEGLLHALGKWLSPAEPQFESLAEEAAQETLLRVLAHINAFEGRSYFTTWAHKIAVRAALTELRRRRWQDVSLESLLERDGGEVTPSLMADAAPGPEQATGQADLLARVQRMMEEELTDKQMRAMQAVVLRGMPMAEAARRMNMERNALYKLLHDARLRLRRRLRREGVTVGELLADFERA